MGNLKEFELAKRPRGYLQLKPGDVAAGKSTEEAAAFGPDFSGVADYIDAITYAIWEGKKVELCEEYYSEDCPVYTLAGQTVGATDVIAATHRTLAAFPDRVLYPEGLLWGMEPPAAEGGTPRYHSSHLISTHMTNLGDSEYGPATGRAARIRVIAHCVIEGTVIVKEWLVRDNFALAVQLGFEPGTVARRWAEKPLQKRQAEWLEAEFARVASRVVVRGDGGPAPPAKEGPHLQVAAALEAVWASGGSNEAVAAMYHPHCWFVGPANRDLVGHAAMVAHFQELLALLPGAGFTVDYTCGNNGLGSGSGSMPGDAWVALRWTLAGIHAGAGRWGEPSGAKVVVLGESHMLLRRGAVVREITVFDELSVMVQVERARLV